MFKGIFNYFNKLELCLWISSTTLILISFFIFDRVNYLALTASIIGVTSLIFCAKGNPIGQALMILFSILYGIISYSFAYYGEMITYLGMTMPMAILSLISWLRHPYKDSKSEVEVNHVKGKEYIAMTVLTIVVTTLFYFILEAAGTANIIPSTISVATSFSAAYLTFRRSPYYAVCYAVNDIVLIILWALASMEDISYLSVMICFIAFLANDIYGFISWRKMGQNQSSHEKF